MSHGLISTLLRRLRNTTLILSHLGIELKFISHRLLVSQGSHIIQKVDFGSSGHDPVLQSVPDAARVEQEVVRQRHKDEQADE